MIAPHRIKFRDKFNTDFDLICGAAFDSDNGNTETFLNKETVSSNVYDGSRRNVHGYHYTEVMIVSITLIKQDYQDINERENRRILSWLTGSNRVEELTVYNDDSEVISYRLIGNIISIEQYKLGNGRIVGYIINFENIAPYAFSYPKTITRTKEDKNTFTINCSSDAYEKHIYPKIQVTIGKPNNDGVLCLPTSEDPTVDGYKMLDNTVYQYNNNYYVKINEQKQTLSGVFATDIEKQSSDASTYNKYYLCNTDNYIYKGIINESSSYAWERLIKVGAGFEIKNTHYDNGKDITVSMTVTDNYENEVIAIDGNNRIISSSATPMRIIGNSFNWEWLYFVPGENTITISGDCTVTFQWVEPIKIGNL